MMQLCNTSGGVKGLTISFIHFTLITNATLGLFRVANNQAEILPIKFCMEQKHEHDFNRCISY
jgi:hypothetical protein